MRCLLGNVVRMVAYAQMEPRCRTCWTSSRIETMPRLWAEILEVAGGLAVVAVELRSKRVVCGLTTRVVKLEAPDIETVL